MNGPFALRHPLDGAISAGQGRHANHVDVLPEPTVISIAALPRRDAVVGDMLDLWVEGRLRRIGPAEWLLVEPAADSGLREEVARRLAGEALVTDQSSGRTVLRLSGPDCRAILAKCTPLDLDRGVFAIGQSASALFNHTSANIARLAEDEFEISLMRSFAVFAFEELMEMGLEFGLTAGFAT